MKVQLYIVYQNFLIVVTLQVLLSGLKNNQYPLEIFILLLILG